MKDYDVVDGGCNHHVGDHSRLLNCIQVLPSRIKLSLEKEGRDESIGVDLSKMCCLRIHAYSQEEGFTEESYRCNRYEEYDNSYSTFI
jgi:hypothetical protein